MPQWQWGQSDGWSKGVVLLCFFFRSALSATAPASLVASVMWDGAIVSGHVASHTRTRPPFHGTIVAPSGRFRLAYKMYDVT